jgi:hypothetical protein
LRRGLIALLLSFLFAIYSGFPTKNHYWDGVGFALNAEGIGDGFALNAEGIGDIDGVVRNPGDFRDLTDIYYNPNHLLYNLTGRLLYRTARSWFPAVRALDVLRLASTFLSVATAGLVFLFLQRCWGDLGLSFWLTLSMALSATWWKFSTDANAYVPCTFLLTLAAYRLGDPESPPRAVTIGLVHASAMLLHQISIFFLPGAMFGLWIHPRRRDNAERLRSWVEYLGTAGFLVLGAYLCVWFVMLDRPWAPGAFLEWLTSNGNDVLSGRTLGGNAIETLRSTLRVFFGGRLRLAWEHSGGFGLAVAITVFVLSFSRLAWALCARHTSESGAVSVSPRGPQPDVGILAWWIVPFAVFLFTWLTEYPYYRLFYLPAVVCLAARLIAGGALAVRGRRALPPFVVCMAVFNFTAYIYPYSRESATPPIELARKASTVWTGNDVILYREFTCDNWMMRYFSPRTSWFQADLSSPDKVASYLAAARSGGRRIWLDTTLLGQLEGNSEMRAWFQNFGGLSRPWGLSTSKHKIQFSQVMIRRSNGGQPPSTLPGLSRQAVR